MNRRANAIVGVGVALLVVLLGYLFFNKGYLWWFSLDHNSKQPYGIKYFVELLESTSGEKFVEIGNPLNEFLTEDREGNYVAIGYDFYYFDRDFEALLNFINDGNTAWISAITFPYQFDSLFHPHWYQYYEDYDTTIYDENYYDSLYYADTLMYLADSLRFIYSDSVILKLNEANTTLKFVVKDTTYSNWWKRFYPEFYSDSVLEQISFIGYVDDSYNLLEYEYGEGKLFLFSTPEVYSNYYLQDYQTLNYINETMKLWQNDTVYFDKVSQYPQFENNDFRTAEFSEGPLGFIRSQPLLLLAWYIIILLSIVFFVLGLKRTQPVMRTLPELKNASLEYIKTIGQLYYNSRQHQFIAEREKELLLHYIRTRYQIPTKEIDEKFMRKLSRLSGVPFEQIRKMFEKLKSVAILDEVSDRYFVDFQERVSQFYQKSEEAIRFKRKDNGRKRE
jgi:hypothetical protein